jgi:thienamycin biosynthesis protein ThnO
MTTLDVDHAAATISAGRSVLVLDCLRGREACSTFARYDIGPASPLPIARASRAPRLLQWEMLQAANHAGAALREFGQGEWLRLLAAAGRQFAYGDGAAACAELTSRCTGLPRVRVLKAFATLAADLENMGEILNVQVPGGDAETFYRSQPDPARRWLAVPRGRHLAVRIPGNFPTININWLVALAARRPVLLCASLLDPFTVHRLAVSLYQAGLPDHALSLCYHDAAAWWSRADQIMTSGDLPECQRDASDVHRYHQGRSKLVVGGHEPTDEIVARIALNAMQGCGRLCTNFSAVLTDGDAERLAERLAAQMAGFEIVPLADPRAWVPTFPHRQIGESIAGQIEAAQRRGARDVTAAHATTPLRVVSADGLYLRPTVLLVDADDPIFGAEFPFPFVSVAKVRTNELLERCRHSLVVAVLGLPRARVDEFVLDPSIDKVFVGQQFDRAYDPTAPHQGWLTDFLFKKKVTCDEYCCR